jgi:hypothetical protein
MFDIELEASVKVICGVTTRGVTMIGAGEEHCADGVSLHKSSIRAPKEVHDTYLALQEFGLSFLNLPIIDFLKEDFFNLAFGTDPT